MGARSEPPLWGKYQIGGGNMIGGVILAAAAWWATIRIIRKLYEHDVEGRDD